MEEDNKELSIGDIIEDIGNKLYDLNYRSEDLNHRLEYVEYTLFNGLLRAESLINLAIKHKLITNEELNEEIKKTVKNTEIAYNQEHNSKTINIDIKNEKKDENNGQ